VAGDLQLASGNWYLAIGNLPELKIRIVEMQKM
jgi:hypothetical protein